MAKDRAAKERERAKRVKHKKLRDEARRIQVRRQLEHLYEVMFEPGPRGLQAAYSLDTETGLPLPAPEYQREIDKRLDPAFRDVLEQISSGLLAGGLQYVNGVEVAIMDTSISPRVRTRPLPAALLRITSTPWEWIGSGFRPGESADLVFWLVPVCTGPDEESFSPLVLAVDRQQRLMAWVIDEEGKGWLPVSKPHALLECSFEPYETLDEFFEADPGIVSALRATGAISGDAFTGRLDPDNPAVREAVTMISFLQEGLLLSLNALVHDQVKATRRINELWDENTALSSLEHEVAVLGRRLASSQQELERQKALLAQRRATSSHHPKVPARSLVDRLGSVFADSEEHSPR